MNLGSLLLKQMPGLNYLLILSEYSDSVDFSGFSKRAISSIDSKNSIECALIGHAEVKKSDFIVLPIDLNGNDQTLYLVNIKT